MKIKERETRLTLHEHDDDDDDDDVYEVYVLSSHSPATNIQEIGRLSFYLVKV